ncbi:MAG: energy transducer TonB [Bacteroidota bacterium]|jgi:phosphotransferase system IIB component
MKIRFLLLSLFAFYHQLHAQSLTEDQKQIEQKIIRSWAKYRLDTKDGSQISDERLQKSVASMFIFKKGNVGVVIFGDKAQQMRYAVSSSLLTVNSMSYTIEKLTEYELVFSQNFPNTPDNELLRYHYVSTKESSGDYFYNQFIKPNIRTQENGEIAFRFNEYVFPKFKLLSPYSTIINDFNGVYETSYDLIEQYFNFPPKKKGYFSVSFAIGKDGILKNITVKESSDSTYNDALVQAISQTRNRWLPAEYANQKVETQFDYVFKYEDVEGLNNDFDFAIYQSNLTKANRFYENKQYVKAIKLYTKCILMQDEDTEPLYKRADCYFALKVNKNACLDWSYLAKKGQKKAENLFYEHCMK